MSLYEGYRIEAVVDWVELEIELQRASNGGALNRIGRNELGFNAHFRPLDKGSGGAATAFSFRLQDPPNWRRVNELLQALSEQHPFAAEPLITGMEVSLDAYASEPCIDVLAKLTAERYRFMQTVVSKNHRYSGRLGRKLDAKGIAANTLQKHLADGRNIVIGNRTDSLSQRLYVKTTDNAGNLALPREQWRSRWELTMQGSGMPFHSLDLALHYRFQELSNYFATRQPRDGLSDLEHLVMDGRLQPGAKRKNPVARRWYASKTVADSTSNAVVYTALRNLTRRMNSRRRGSPKWRPDRNSVNSALQNPRNAEKSPFTSINYIRT